MDIGTPLSQLGVDVALALNDVYPALLRDTALMCAAVAAAAVGLSILVWAILRRRSAWLSRRGADLKFHYVLMGLLLLLLLVQLQHRSGTADTILLAVSAAAAGIAIFGLLTWRRMGVGFAILSLWLSLPVKEASSLGAVVRDWADIGRYSVPGKVGVFAVDQYIADRTAVLALIAALLTVIVAAYYTRRRYLFTGSVIRWFAGVSACPKCGAILTGTGDFCTACGAPITGRPRSQLKWAAKDNGKNCPTCGRGLHGQNLCPQCYNTDEFRAAMKDTAKDSVKGEFVKYGVLALVAAMVFAPHFLGNTLEYLTKGGAAVNNAFTDRFNEWYADPTVAEDSQWLGGFDAAAQELYDYNARGFRAVSRRMSYSDLYTYIQYLEGSYYQMAVMQDVSEAVHTGDQENKSQLAQYFNETQNMQQRALMSGMSLLLGTNKLRAGENIVVDGVRFYLSFPPMWLLIAVLFGAGALGLVGGILLYRREPDGSPFVEAAAMPDTTEKMAEQMVRRAAAERKDRVYALIGALIAVICLGIGIFIETWTAPAGEPTYETAVDMGFTMNGTVLVVWFAQSRTDPGAALARSEDALARIASCRESMEFLSGLEPAEENEEARAIATELIDVLNEAQSALERGELPSQETAVRASSLLVEGMKLDQEMKISAAFDAVEDLF